MLSITEKGPTKINDEKETQFSLAPFLLAWYTWRKSK